MPNHNMVRASFKFLVKMKSCTVNDAHLQLMSVPRTKKTKGGTFVDDLSRGIRVHDAYMMYY